MISRVSMSLICHATEDPKKVERALLNLIPDGLRGSISISYSIAKGHHGNEIMLASIEESERAPEIVDYILKLLPPADLLRIRDDLNRFYDSRSTLFLRLDKQRAYGGMLRLSEGDDIIRVKISLLMRKGGTEEVLRALNLV